MFMLSTDAEDVVVFLLTMQTFSFGIIRHTGELTPKSLSIYILVVGGASIFKLGQTHLETRETDSP